VRADRLVDPCATGYAAHDPAGAMAVHPLAFAAQEDRPVEAFSDRKVDGAGGAGCEWDGDDLAAFAQHGQGAVPALESEFVDVGAERFGEAQPVDRQERNQGVLVGGAESRRDEQCPDFVAIQRNGV